MHENLSQEGLSICCNLVLPCTADAILPRPHPSSSLCLQVLANALCLCVSRCAESIQHAVTAVGGAGHGG